jgi:hypothetical protein
MHAFKRLAIAVLGLSAFLLFALGTPAQAQHTKYLHALASLREAREQLGTVRNPGFAGVRDRALAEIADAIREVDAAVRAEGKDPYQTPPPRSAGSDDRPMRQAVVLLNKARADIDAEPDETGHQGLQKRALRHVDAALDILKDALHM